MTQRNKNLSDHVYPWKKIICNLFHPKCFEKRVVWCNVLKRKKEDGVAAKVSFVSAAQWMHESLQKVRKCGVHDLGT